MIGPSFPDLLADAQRGDAQAFAQLWEATQPALLRFCRTLAGPAGDDAASEAWLAAIEGLRRFRGDEQGFRAWLFTIARRKVVDHQRRERPERLRPLDEASVEHTLPGRDAAEVAEERMSTQEALALVARLPADQAEVVLLRVVAGLDVAQVAKVVGKSPGAVRVSAHRGLRRLAVLLEQAGVTREASVAFPSRDA